MRILSIIALVFISTSVTGKSVPLKFPAEKNGLKILPQRFEYALLDKDRLQVGDILIDFRQIDFQLIQTDRGDLQKVRFQWPQALFSQGEVVIKDNAGKAIWSQKIGKTESSGKTPSGRLRADLQSFESTYKLDTLLRELKYYPFFHFCLQREEPSTRVFMCSKPLFVRNTDAKRSIILSRDSLRPETYVEINGRGVNPQGAVILNSPDEFIFFRTLLLSGATLEIQTRTKHVDFKDIFLSPDGNQLVIRASGAEPVYEDRIARLPNGDWQTLLDVERPLTYLRAQGDVPMKQEFLVEGTLRPESIKAFAEDPPSHVYSDNVTLKVKTPRGSLDWKLDNLERGKNTRFLNVPTDKGTFVAMIDMERKSAWEASLGASLPLWAEAKLKRFFSDTWSAHLFSSMQLAQPKDFPQLSTFGINVLYTFGLGALGLGIDSYSAKLDSVQSSYMTASLLGEFDGFELRATLAQLSGDKVKPMHLEAAYLLRYESSDLLYFKYGLGYRSDKIGTEAHSEVLAKASAHWVF